MSGLPYDFLNCLTGDEHVDELLSFRYLNAKHKVVTVYDVSEDELDFVSQHILYLINMKTQSSKTLTTLPSEDYDVSFDLEKGEVVVTSPDERRYTI